MIIYPVMYAIAYKFQGEIWVNFEKQEDTHTLSFECLLPTEEMAKDYINDVLTQDDYSVVPVTIRGFNNGTSHFEYKGPSQWD